MRVIRQIATFMALAATMAAAQTQPSTSSTTTRATSGPVIDASGWTVIFRSDDPIVWNSGSGDPTDANGYAVTTDKVPADMRYLRLARTDSGGAVII